MNWDDPFHTRPFDTFVENLFTWPGVLGRFHFTSGVMVVQKMVQYYCSDEKLASIPAFKSYFMWLPRLEVTTSWRWKFRSRGFRGRRPKNWQIEKWKKSKIMRLIPLEIGVVNTQSAEQALFIRRSNSTREYGILHTSVRWQSKSVRMDVRT